MRCFLYISETIEVTVKPHEITVIDISLKTVNATGMHQTATILTGKSCCKIGIQCTAWYNVKMFIGYVTDTLNSAIPNAHIVAKGVNETRSQLNGSYSLVLPAGNYS